MMTLMDTFLRLRHHRELSPDFVVVLIACLFQGQ